MPIMDKEKEVLDKTLETWNAYLELDEDNKDETNDFRFHIHAIQRIILGRSTWRVLRDMNREWDEEIIQKFDERINRPNTNTEIKS